MVLMMVICTIIFALTLSARMTEIGIETQRLMDYTANRENNYLMARSALEIGLSLLQNDSGDTDSLQDYWARGEITLQWEGRPVSLRIVDEESKFPLSYMQQHTDDCAYLEQALKRFMESAGVSSGNAAVDQFLDWVDPDGARRDQGAEETDYADGRKFKDGPCHSIYEVLALPAWSELPHYKSPRQALDWAETGLAVGGSGSGGTSSGGTSSGGEDSASSPNQASDGKGKTEFGGNSFNSSVPEAQTLGREASSPWEEWMSVYSSGKVNVNTAPPEVLRCLDEKMTETVVNEIDSQRRTTAFKDINDLRNIAGFDEDLRHRLSNYLCVKSRVFEVRATVRSIPGTVCLRAIVERSGNQITVLRWEVQ
ncbi:general secretion pathway protein GspK [bacterium]|nr:general secretion pathway protein GspK [bacterium]